MPLKQTHSAPIIKMGQPKHTLNQLVSKPTLMDNQENKELGGKYYAI